MRTVQNAGPPAPRTQAVVVSLLCVYSFSEHDYAGIPKSMVYFGQVWFSVHSMCMHDSKFEFSKHDL